MSRKKFLKKFLSMSLAVGSLNFLPAVPIFDAGIFQVSTAHAEIKTFAAKNTAMTDVESLTNAAKSTAKERALNLAQKKAELFLKTLSPTLRGNLTDEDISAVIRNNFQIVAEPQYRKLYYQAVDDNGNDLGRTGEIYEATITIQIDTAALDNYRKLGAQEREKLINQAKNSQAAFEEIDRDFEELRQNARRKSPQQLQADIKKFENKVSKAEKRRKKNKPARKQEISAPANKPVAKENKTAVTENKPVTNQPMQFSQPEKLDGGIGSAFDKKGFIVENATSNNGTLINEKPRYGGNGKLYSRGIARFGNGDDALYAHYDVNKDWRNTYFGGESPKNTFPLLVTLNFQGEEIYKIKSNAGITLYAIWTGDEMPTFTSYYILGRQKDGKWVKYIDTDNIIKTYFGKNAHLVGVSPKIVVKNDSIILSYYATLSGIFGRITEKGKFRFKWDEAAQWFGVEKVTY